MGKCIRNQLLWIGRLIKTCYSGTETKVRHTKKKILQIRSLADYKLEYLHCSQHTSTDSYSLQFLSHVTNNMLSFFNVCFCINLLFNIHLLAFAVIYTLTIFPVHRCKNIYFYFYFPCMSNRKNGNAKWKQIWRRLYSWTTHIVFSSPNILAVLAWIRILDRTCQWEDRANELKSTNQPFK